MCSKCVPQWRKEGRENTRYQVRKRDKFTCQDCKKKWKPYSRHFDVHHLNGLCGKKSRAYDKISEMSNLVTLCHKCHFNRHDWAGAAKLRLSYFLLKETYNLRQQGLSLKQIGDNYKISPEAVRLRLLTWIKRYPHV